MTMAESFLYVSFVAEVALFIYYLWTANDTKPVKNRTREQKLNTLTVMIEGWKISLVLFAISLLLFFIYYAALGNLMTAQTQVTFSDGEITTIQSNDYMLGYNLLPIMIAIVFIDFALLTWRIFNQTQLMAYLFGAT